MGTLYEDWHQELFLVADVVVVGPSIDRKYICRHQYDGRTTTSGLPVIPDTIARGIFCLSSRTSTP